MMSGKLVEARQGENSVAKNTPDVQWLSNFDRQTSGFEPELLQENMSLQLSIIVALKLYIPTRGKLLLFTFSSQNCKLFCNNICAEIKFYKL